MPGLAAVVGGLAVVFAVLAVATTVLPVVAMVYVALRVQDARRPDPDPRLGMKTAFHMIHSLAVVMTLVGASVFMVDLMNGAIAGNKQNVAPQPNVFGGPQAAPAPKKDGFNEVQRVAAALIASGTLFGIVFWALLLGTNDSALRSVRRVFVGGRMALCLLVVMMTFTALLVVLMQKAPETEVTESLIAMLVVWFPAACAHMVLFFTTVGESKGRARRGSDEDRGWRPSDD